MLSGCVLQCKVIATSNPLVVINQTGNHVHRAVVRPPSPVPADLGMSYPVDAFDFNSHSQMVRSITLRALTVHTIYTDKAPSLDVVAMRPEETVHPKNSPFAARWPPTTCSCSQKYANALCKLQAIESRQRPVHTDTLLRCTNLVVETIESQFECTKCSCNPYAAVHLVMVFQIFSTWFPDQCCYPFRVGNLEFRITFCQHRLTDEETRFGQRRPRVQGDFESCQLPKKRGCKNRNGEQQL